MLEHLLMIKNECSCSIFSECGLSDMTVKQIAYLKVISEQGDVTFSRRAEISKMSNASFTELVNKFVRMECVYREPSRDDGRILYIRLTDKGKKIAKAEEDALRRVIERMIDSLDEHELDLLIGILEKVR
jgi:DNA-binding MarR family transcriptional regulator